MKHLRKVLALVLAVLMALTPITPAFAATNEVTKDTTVSVSGLETGDKVKFIQVIKWVDGTGWAWVDGLEAAATTAGVTLPSLTTITGTTTPSVTAGAISAEHAAIIAKAAAGLSGTEVTESSKTATLTNAASGLYYAQVIPATADYLYNTIFVGADFKSDNGTNTIAADTATLAQATGAEKAIAKKEQVTLTKDSTGSTDNLKYDHNVGDVIDFTITSNIPAYGAGYVDPTYVITDVMESGLAYWNKTADAAATTAASGVNVTVADIADFTAGQDYNVAIDGQKLTVTLTETGLGKVAAKGEAKQITVTYSGKIQSLDAANITVSEKTNTATVKFSNKPTDKNSYSLLEDKTRHYTFSIDANLLGKTGEAYTTDELIKVGRDAQGNLLTEKHEYHSGLIMTEESPLQGAVFALFKENPTADDYASEAAAQASSKIYKNDVFTTGLVTSDAMGRLNIAGLDAGTYYLREITAPDGFVRDNRTFTITIDATYDEIEGGTYTNSDNILVKYDAYKVLEGYTVTVNDGSNNVVSTYNILNDNASAPEETKVTMAEYQEITGQEFAGDIMTPITNTEGTELPSTGGMGTTILYTIGGIMLVGGAIALVSKKRVANMEK